MPIPSLIPDALLDNLPIDHEEQFYEIVRAAESSLNLARNSVPPFDERSFYEWRVQFVREVHAAAVKCGVSGLPTVGQAVQSDRTLDNFDAALTAIITPIRLTYLPRRRVDTVELSIVTKESLRSDLEILRQRINDANISDELREILHRRIDEIERELYKKRVRLSPLWLLIGAIHLIPDTVGTLSDASGARDNIVSAASAMSDVFTQEKAAEDREQVRLQGKVPALEHQPVRALTDQRHDS